MIVVSNTSPLYYLIAVQQAEILPQLFETIYVPPAVIRELSHANTPPAVRQWAATQPSWLRIDRLARPLDVELSANLDQGEAEAIQLAEEKHADLLIMDEWKGRTIAQRHGLPLTGALGILGIAYQKLILEDPISILAMMRAQGFRIHERLVERFQHLLLTKYRA
jgi:predicted nucleic acid-binding protein